MQKSRNKICVSDRITQFSVHNAACQVSTLDIRPLMKPSELMKKC